MPVQALPEAPGWECSFGSFGMCIPGLLDSEARVTLDTISDPTVILGRYCCSSHHGNVVSKISQGTVTCP